MAERKPKKKEPIAVKKPRVRRKKEEVTVEPIVEKSPETPQFGVWLVVAAVAALAIAVVVS